MTIHATLRYVLSFSFFFSILACRDEKIPATSVPENVPDIHARFTLLAPEQTGVQFSNNFLEDFNYNIYTYEYLYNGCGVAVGDVNGDGLPDLYFAAAFGSNKLYINLGDFKFADVTEAAGVAAQIGYKTGVNMADVNGDGLMDIHCARTSKDDDGQKNDHMFINLGVKDINGMKVPIFEDQAKVLGLEDNSNTNHACFLILTEMAILIFLYSTTGPALTKQLKYVYNKIKMEQHPALPLRIRPLSPTASIEMTKVGLSILLQPQG